MKEKERDSQASKIHRGRNEVQRSMRGGMRDNEGEMGSLVTIEK